MGKFNRLFHRVALFAVSRLIAMAPKNTSVAMIVIDRNVATDEVLTLSTGSNCMSYHDLAQMLAFSAQYMAEMEMKRQGTIH